MENLNEEQAKELYFLAFDENEDGILDDIVEFSTNEQGLVSEVLIDYNHDYRADMKIYFEYDATGRLIKKSKDKNLNGEIDSIETYEYDENGKATIIYDDNADGKADYLETPDGEIKDLRKKKDIILERIRNIFPPNTRNKLK